MQLKIDIDTEMIERLSKQAVNEKRSIPRQAEVVLRMALGLPFPPVQSTPKKTEVQNEQRQPA